MQDDKQLFQIITNTRCNAIKYRSFNLVLLAGAPADFKTSTRSRLDYIL